MSWVVERELRRYWDDARRDGVRLALAEFAAPSIPAAENFSTLPMFQGRTIEA
jgi:hypothetical protein